MMSLARGISGPKTTPHPKDGIMQPQSTSPRKRILQTILAAVSIFNLAACLHDSDDPVTPEPPSTAFVFAVTSDYKSGSYSAVGLDSAFSRVGVEAIHSDAVTYYRGGDDIFILNRMMRDNLQVIDRRSLLTVMQIAFPALSNPYDIAVKDSLLYVAFYGLDKILIYAQGDGSPQGEIDLSAYADSADGFAEASALRFVEGDLYVLTANLDSKTHGPPMPPHLLKIDIASRQVTAALELPFRNPASLTYDSAAGRFHIPCMGEYIHPDFSINADGAILSVDLAAFAVADTLITEAALGGNLNAALLHGGKLFLSLGTGSEDRIVAISLADAEVEEVTSLGAYATGGMAIDAATATLIVGDRAGKTLRRFDTDTFVENTAYRVPLNLPPASLAVIR